MRGIHVCIVGILLGLVGCAPINSDFSCNKTAGDSCLTIEQVDAMTRYADDPVMMQPSHHAKTTNHMHQRGVWLSTQSQ